MIELVIAVLFAVLPTCATEDSADCKWDAQHQGNGEGRSFIALANTEGDDPAIIYVR